mgnify:CR=1 FL=1
MMNKLDNNEMNMNDIDLIEPSIEFVECMGNDDTVVNAARVSFGKESNNFTKEQNDKLIGYLAKHKHWSPFAHPQITFRTKFGLPIARQLAKHQVGGVVNECFSDDTEVLTKEGWKFWNTVNENDELATPELDGSSYSFENPIELICNDYEGDMYHIYSRDLDMCVTPNHDQYISYYVDGAWSEYEKCPTQEVIKLYPTAKTLELKSLGISSKELKYYEIIHYSGKVYCARTRTGLLIVRRNGKSCVSGNCSRRYRDDNIQFENIDIFRTRPKNVKQGSDINSVVENNEEIKELYKNFLKTGEKLYQYFIKCGVCPEQSRYVLPQAMITEWYWTGSLYYFARVCKDRLSPLAQLETRKIAEQISECLQKQFPVSWNALMQNRDKME